MQVSPSDWERSECYKSFFIYICIELNKIYLISSFTKPPIENMIAFTAKLSRVIFFVIIIQYKVDQCMALAYNIESPSYCFLDIPDSSKVNSLLEALTTSKSLTKSNQYRFFASFFFLFTVIEGYSFNSALIHNG